MHKTHLVWFKEIDRSPPDVDHSPKPTENHRATEPVDSFQKVSQPGPRVGERTVESGAREAKGKDTAQLQIH